MLVVFAGLPGTGKTTLARALARDRRAALIRVDAIEAALTRSASIGTVGAAGYDVGREVAAGCLAVGTPVVVDAVNPVAEARAGWRQTAAAAGADLHVFEVVLADLAEHRRRVEQRRSDLPGLTVPTWQQVLERRYEPWDVARDGERLVVDGDDAAAALAVIHTELGPRPPSGGWAPRYG